MTDFTPDPFKDFTPRANAPKQVAIANAEAIEHEEAIIWYESLPDEAKPLAKRLLCQCGAVAFMSQKETAQAIIDRLAGIVIKRSFNGEEKALRDIISAANSWLDRVEGRPKQVIDANVNLSYAALLDEVNDRRDKLLEGDYRRAE